MKISCIFIMLTCFNFSNAQKATYSVRDLNVVYPISVEIDKINGGYGELKVGGALENALFEAGFNVVSSLVAYSEAKTSIEYFSNKIEISSSSPKKYYKSVYLVDFDEPSITTGGSKEWFNELNGRIIDLVNGNRLIATFSFKNDDKPVEVSKACNEIAMALYKKSEK